MGDGKMAEYKRIGQKKQEETGKQRQIKRQQNEPVFNRLHTLDGNPLLTGEVPFYPVQSSHAETLLKIPSSEKRHEFAMRLQQTYGNRYVQRLVESVRAQAKLNVRSTKDVHEPEVDNVAKVVSRSFNTSVQLQEDNKIEPEVEPALQGVRDGGQTKNNSVQRMVVAATDDMAKVKDPLVWNNLEFAKSESGGYVGDMMDWNQFKSEEPVRIVGHGDPDTGQLTAESGRSAKMFDADTIRNRIARAKGLDRSKMNWASKLLWGKKLKKIEFQSCYAAKKTPAASALGAAPVAPAPAPTALIDRMGKELSNIGQKGVEVAGRPGIAFGFKGMGAATSELSEVEFDRTMDEMWTRNPKTRRGADIFKAKGVYNDPWVIAGVPTEADWNLLPIEDKMKKVAKQMKKYWKDFKAEMGPAGFLDTATEIRKITS